MKHRGIQIPKLLAALLVLINALALPLGGKCIEPDGRLCSTCPDTPCPIEFRSAAVASDRQSPPEIRGSDRDCDSGGCHYLTFDYSPVVKAVSPARPLSVIAALSPVAALPVKCVWLPLPPTVCRANAPPPFHRLACPPLPARAPPAIS